MRSATGVALILVLAYAGEARAVGVFVSTLGGAAERPDPVVTDGGGSASAMLTGDAGAYVFAYTLNFTGLSSDVVAGHIHYGIDPPGANPLEQTGPAVHPLNANFAALGTEGSVTGEWRYDDAEMPLTVALADSLMDGELYFNVHSVNFTDGEIRGQIDLVAAGGGDDGGAAIPLPAPLLLGLVGLATAGWAVRRRPAA